MKLSTKLIEHYAIQIHSKHRLPSFAVLLMNAILTIAFWFELSRSRRHLRYLTDDELRDIGLSRGDAEEEARRPFYDF